MTARHTDPVSSHEAVDRIDNNKTLRRYVEDGCHWVGALGFMFSDDDLLMYVEEVTQRRQQRNVIARTRGKLEAAGVIERVGVRERAGMGRALHFRLTSPATTPRQHPLF